jgi:PAS domain-containing protein
MDDKADLLRALPPLSSYSPEESVAASLDRAQNYHDQLVAAMPGLIVHRDGMILHCSGTLARLLGYDSVGEVMALPDIMALIPEDARMAERNAYASRARSSRWPAASSAIGPTPASSGSTSCSNRWTGAARPR